MKILFFISFLLYSALGLSQGFPNNQSVSNASTLYHAKGGLTADVGFVNTRYPDTATANLTYIAQEPGGQIAVGNTVYVRDSTATKWIEIGSGSIVVNGDTTYVQLPLYVDTAGGIRTLKILHDDGLISGGVVTKGIADWDLDVTNAIYYKGNKAYSSPSSTVTIDTADATYDRIDVIGVDTTGNVVVITGTPSATPIAPQVNPSSQLLLTTITVKAGSTFAPVITKIIYDEGTEWDTATSGTISAFFNNADNPYNGSKDIFVQTYENGGALEFTDSEPDTVTSNMVLKYFLYLNSEFTNSFQVQFFNDSDPVSNSLSFNSGFGLNPNNVNVYQNISIPLTSFNFSSNYFNKVKITMAGEDVSGAAGYYLDYIQLQKGLSQTGSGSCPLCIVDIHVSLDSTQQIAIRQNGDTAFVGNWTGGGSGGVTPEQISDSLHNITLQRAYNNAPTAVPQISNITGYPIDFRAGPLSGLHSDLLLTGGGAELNSTYGTSFTGISNGIIGSRPTATTGVPAIELNAARTDNDTLPNSSIFLSISPDFIHIQNIVSPTKVVIQNADTLLTPPDYIWVDDNDTLKKAAYPAGGSGGITQSQLDDSTAAIRADFPTVTGVTQDQLDDTAQAIRDDKQDNITLTTTGSSGAATLTGSTLNIPQYLGSSGVEVKQEYTGSSSVTVTDSTTWLIINPSSLAAQITVTMPASPTDKQTINISFGGTIITGNVVTVLSIHENTGQTILQPTSPSNVEAGETITYRYNSTNSIWYRL